jgi:uncharacterized damage-inducible protein DinB
MKREVWLRELPVETDPLRHLLLCSFRQVEEEGIAQTEGLSDEEVWKSPHGLSPIGFHLRHMAESVDRLLSYAEGRQLSELQLEVLRQELTDTLPLLSLLVLLEQRLNEARERVLALNPEDFSATRYIGRSRIAVPLGTLLAHIAEHTQRHLGQLVTTAKLVRALRD